MNFDLPGDIFRRKNSAMVSKIVLDDYKDKATELSIKKFKAKIVLGAYREQLTNRLQNEMRHIDMRHVDRFGILRLTQIVPVFDSKNLSKDFI